MRVFSSFLLLALAALAGAACGGSVESTGTGDGTGTGSGAGTSDGTATGSGTVKTGGSKTPTASPSGSGCTYPEIDNPPECPPAYTREPPFSCTTIGLKCWYPGVGDGDGKGCWSTALLACVGSDFDGGADGGTTGHWIGAQ